MLTYQAKRKLFIDVKWSLDDFKGLDHGQSIIRKPPKDNATEWERNVWYSYCVAYIDRYGRWHVSQLELHAEHIAQLFEAAAQAWVDGNNSGNDRKMEAGNRKCDKLRKEAENICRSYGLEEFDYPGLYPTFKRNGVAYHFQESDLIRALRGLESNR